MVAGDGSLWQGGALRKPDKVIPPMLRSCCAAAVLLAASACTRTAGSPASPAPISEATLKEVTRTLSLEEFEGRAPGTAGEEKTLAYLVEQFARAGLQPGNHGSWFQDVPLVEITASNHEPLTIAGKSYAIGQDWVGVTYREAPRIDLDASEIVFVGYGVVAPEKGWQRTYARSWASRRRCDSRSDEGCDEHRAGFSRRQAAMAGLQDLR